MPDANTGKDSAGQLISVVITCYNLEAYIEDAVRSVLDQRDAGAFEIIVVDDCSTDTSRHILAQFPNIRIVDMEQNSGVMLAMIRGTEAAYGDIVCYLDGDDIWEPEKLSEVRRAFRNPGLALLTHDLSFMHGNGQPLTRESRPGAVFGSADPGHWPELVREGILSIGDYVWLGSALSIRKSTASWAEFTAWVSAMQDPRNVYQDWPLAYWVASNGAAQSAFLAQVLFRYRIHGANHSGDARTAQRAARNYQRSFLTIHEIHKLAVSRQVARKHVQRIARRAHINQANMLAYQGRRLAAGRLLIKVLPRLLARDREAPAIFKLAVLIAVGPRVAAWIKARAS